MYMTVVTLLATESTTTTHLDPATLNDAIWVFAAQEVRLEHVRVAVRPNQLDIVMFCCGVTAGEVRAAAIAICQRVCEGSPLLRGWRVCQ
jgi:hypothetical protein